MYYIYQHIDLEGNIFYIGKGTMSAYRYYKGYDRAYSKKSRSKDWFLKSKNGYTVNIIELSEDLNYILSLEDLFVDKCKTCVNKQSNKVFKDYRLTKISDSLGTLEVLGRIWYISSDGKYFTDKMKELTLFDTGRGYLSCKISKHPINKNIYIHKLVAQLFIPNPNNYPQINHKNGNKYDNSVENLEWCTQKQNNQHSLKINTFKPKKTKKILQYGIDDTFVKEWESMKEISNFYKKSISWVSWCIKTKNIINYTYFKHK